MSDDSMVSPKRFLLDFLDPSWATDVNIKPDEIAHAMPADFSTEEQTDIRSDAIKSSQKGQWHEFGLPTLSDDH